MFLVRATVYLFDFGNVQALDVVLEASFDAYGCSMKLRLDKKKQGTYEKTNGLRYFGNEKFRKENYFGKQKLQVILPIFRTFHTVSIIIVIV